MKSENIRLVIDTLIIPLITAAVFVLWDLNKSVGSLNIQVGVLINSNQSIEYRLNKLEEKVYKTK
jgi:chaperonin cofactor prefoldin